MEKVLINYQGMNGGDFLRSCLWILKNPDKDLQIKYINDSSVLLLDDIWLYKILSTGQVVVNHDIFLLSDLLRWHNLAKDRRDKNVYLYRDWEKYLKQEYEILENNRKFHSSILNSNIDILITHDPWELPIEIVKRKLDKRDFLINKLFNYTWDNVYWIFNSSFEDAAWSMYFNTIKPSNINKENVNELLADTEYRAKSRRNLIKNIGISSNNIISHADILNDRIHDFFNLEKTKIYTEWYEIYSNMNKLKNPPERYYEFLDILKSSKIIFE